MPEPRTKTEPVEGEVLDVAEDAVEDSPMPAPAPWTPDLTQIQTAAGDPAPWGHLLYEMVGHITGSWIDEASLTEWLESYSVQVAQAVNRAAMFEVANTALPLTVEGDPGVALLQFRDEMAQKFKHKAGL